ncbi:MAG: glycoside hydrolase [Bacteroidota bacterium]|nr:glycoside hydrolase [Bacteroidota bacterium]
MKKMFLLFTVLTFSIAARGVLAQSAFPDFSKVILLKGYSKRISGDTIAYRDPVNSSATMALLTRCTDGTMNIEWETNPIPMRMSGRYAYFVWIAAYSTGTSRGDRIFGFYINGKKYFDVKTYKNRTEKRWVLTASDGCALFFEHKASDALDDTYGYMYLKVPLLQFAKGKPLTLKITGAPDNSPDWLMTFMYNFEKSLKVEPLPLYMQHGGTIMQAVNVEVNYPDAQGTATVRIARGKPMSVGLQIGVNDIECAVPVSSSPRDVTVYVSINKEAQKPIRATVLPLQQKNLYFISHSHNDIGYSDLQPDVMKKQLANIAEAMKLIQKTKLYPKEAQYKWNIEIQWPVEEFLTTAGEAQKKEFLDDVKDGSIGLGALLANQLTGLMRPEEFFKLTEFARSLKENYGIALQTAMVTDVPGMTWNMVPALAQAGIRYFSSGPNGSYNSGDRMGYSNIARSDRPFYWRSPSGEEKILYWMAGWGYSHFHYGAIAKNEMKFKKDLAEYFDWQRSIKYPYDIVQVRYSINGDNGPTDSTLSDFVRTWNETYLSPKIILSTVGQMFSDFEKKYGAVLPTYSGDFTPYWEDGALSTAHELGENRIASEKLVQTEALYSIINPQKYNKNKFYNAWRNVLLFDEHTWGAWNSVSDPDTKFAMDQWSIKRGFVDSAVHQTGELLKSIVPDSVHTNVFQVINTNSWKRTDLVIISKSETDAGDVVKDEEGVEVPSQKLTNGDVAFLAQDVPPLSSKIFTLEKGTPSYRSDLSVMGRKITDGNIGIDLDGHAGSIRHFIFGKSRRGLADTNGEHGLNEFFYVDGLDASKALTADSVTISVKEHGPLVASLLVESKAPGCNSLKQEIMVIHGMNRVDIINTIDKKKIRSKEAAHFGFPLNVPDATTRIDLGYAVIKPEEDQLNGSCKDYYSAQRWADVSNGTYGVTLCVNEAPLIEIGEMHSELPNVYHPQWKKKSSPSATLYSYVLNNYWHTNYKADQEGIITYHYSLIPHDGYNAAAITRMGIERSQPLVLLQITPQHKRVSAPFVVNSSKTIVSYLKPSKNGGFLARLYNPSDTKDEFTIELHNNLKTIFISSPFEEKGKQVHVITMAAHEILTLLIE